MSAGFWVEATIFACCVCAKAISVIIVFSSFLVGLSAERATDGATLPGQHTCDDSKGGDTTDYATRNGSSIVFRRRDRLSYYLGLESVAFSQRYPPAMT